MYQTDHVGLLKAINVMALSLPGTEVWSSVHDDTLDNFVSIPFTCRNICVQCAEKHVYCVKRVTVSLFRRGTRHQDGIVLPCVPSDIVVQSMAINCVFKSIYLKMPSLNNNFEDI